MAKMLLWKPHTDRDLVKPNDSKHLDLDSYHISHSAQDMVTAVLNTVHSSPGSTGSKLLAVHQSLVIAYDNNVYHGVVCPQSNLLDSFVGYSISLDQARAIATFIVHQGRRELPLLEEPAVFLLRTSSDPWDKTLAVLVTMVMTGQEPIDKLIDAATPALQHGHFELSRMTMIFTALIFRHDKYGRDRCLLAAARICNVILIENELSMVELLFMFGYVAWSGKLTSIHDNKTYDGKQLFFPHLSDPASLMDLFFVLDLFSWVTRKFAWATDVQRAYRAFAIHFLIRLGQASPAMYWQIMRHLTSSDVREWAEYLSGSHRRCAARIILFAWGISVGGHPNLHLHEVSEMEKQLYDQSIGPETLDLDGPLLEVVYRDAENGDKFEQPFPRFANIWLAMHAQTADGTQCLPIPVEQIQWIDHPISEMIALRRLSTYNNRNRELEPAFINLFLHSKSFNVLLPTLQSHLSWLRGPGIHSHAPTSPSNGTSHDELPNLQLSALQILFGPDLAPNQLSSFWLFICPLCDTQWADFPNIWKFTFVQSFFSVIDGSADSKSVIDEGPDSTATGYLGIKWMEAIWEKVLRPRINKVVIESVEFYWPGVEGGEWNKDELEILYLERKRDQAEHGKRKGELDQSMTKVLQTLATLLEEASVLGLVTVGLAGALSRSPLLADNHLRQDQDSVGRIEAIIRRVLVVENIRLLGGG